MDKLNIKLHLVSVIFVCAILWYIWLQHPGLSNIDNIDMSRIDTNTIVIMKLCWGRLLLGNHRRYRSQMSLQHWVHSLKLAQSTEVLDAVFQGDCAFEPNWNVVGLLPQVPSTPVPAGGTRSLDVPFKALGVVVAPPFWSRSCGHCQKGITLPSCLPVSAKKWPRGQVFPSVGE